MRMGFHCTRFTASAFFLILIAVQCFGELIVLRHPPTDYNGNTRNLTCISEDDDSALVWNHNLQTSENENFQPKRLIPKNFTMCAVFNLTACVARWEKISKWKVVNSADRPMGPVFDYRWEGFHEYVSEKEIGEEDHKFVSILGRSTGNVIFSVRALRNAHVLLCKTEDMTRGLCLRIIIGSSQGRESRIEACYGQECSNIGKIEHPTQVVDLYEWRTFRIKWRYKEGKIEVFKNNEDAAFLEGNFQKWPREFHISVLCEISSRFRFHFYEYFLTEKEGTELSTNPFIYGNEDFCVKLLVGLCFNCELKIDLIDANGTSIGMKYISGNENVRDNKPLSWRSINLTTILRDSLSYVILKIQTILNKGESKGQWAVDNLHVCNSVDTLRKSTITIQGETSYPSVWPKVTCQKLSYTKGAVVDSSSTKTIESDTNQLQQFISSWESDYRFSCARLGAGSSVCDPTGCICDRGYQGIDCAKECASGYYGYNCTKNCAPCFSGICDKANGYCYTGCPDKKLLPPLCKKEFEVPTVVEITDTTAKILQNVELGAGFEIRIFAIILQPGYRTFPANRKELTSTYVADIHGLNPKTTYVVNTHFSVTVKGVAIDADSPKINFTTTAVGDICFEVIPQKNGLTLEYHRELKECKNFLPRFYKVELKSGGEPIRESIASPPFPHNFTNLTAYTIYELTVFVRGSQLWTTSVRTLESAPGEVGNLQVQSKTDTTVILWWNAPEEKNGIIKKYIVRIQRESLLGCVDLKKETPKQDERFEEVNDTKAFFDRLNPYANYTATVTAYTSERGPEKSHNFVTNEATMPTSVVSNLEYDDIGNRLKWEKPEDCTTISGSTKYTRLSFEGVSNWVKNWNLTDQTAYDYYEFNFQLTPYTTYKVRAYVIRDYHGQVNPDLYQEKKWTTAPTAPPKVKDFDVFNADPVENCISLRWQPPYPPHGEIESYHVTINQRGSKVVDKTIKVSDGIPMCKFRKNYICLENLTLPREIVTSTQLQIYAKNRDIEKPGVAHDLTFVPDEFYNKAPGRPLNVTASPQDDGIVMLTWMHPLFSHTKITRFRYYINVLETKLLHRPDIQYPVNYTVTLKRKEYSEMLHLLTSTEYRIAIVAVNGRGNISSAIEKECWTPGSIGFVSEEDRQVNFNGGFIEIKIPTVVNATRNTTLKIIVKGSSTCTPRQSKQSSSPVDLKKSVLEWEAEVYEVGKNIPKSLKIDANGHQGVTSDCFLDPEESYEIEFVATDGYSGKSARLTVSPVHESPSLAWLIIFPIIAIGFILVFVLYRKWRKPSLKTSQQNMLQLDQTTMSIGNSTAPATLKRGTLPPAVTINRVSIHPSSPDVVPSHNPNSYPVKIEKFEEYTKEGLASGLLNSQYVDFAHCLKKPCRYATLPENVAKNRYKDRIPYDETRVVLDEIPGEEHSDYINASYIQGYRKRNAYIATQGPKTKTVKDFWRMIWQENVQVICMLTNVMEGGKKKCEQYWPEVGTKIKYGEILITNTKNSVFADYTFRTFTLRCRKETREVTHLHYTGWPDHGVPMYTQSLVAYLKKLLATPSGTGPVVVHCSAGVGRTGTIILCDTCLRQAVVEKVIDVPAAIVRLRRDRPNMVDNAQQYLLAHLAILESMVAEQTQIRCDNFLLDKIKELKKQLPSDVERLKKAVWQDRALHALESPKAPNQGEVDGNRPSMLIPGPIAQSKNEGKSLDAVNVDGATMKNQYLACRLPSTSNLSDLWNLIKDKNIELVVMLQRPGARDRTRCDIVPGKSALVPTPDLQIERKTIPEEKEHFTIDKLLLTDISNETEMQRPVTVLTFKGWEIGKRGNRPTPESLVSLWMASEKVARKEGQTLVLCHDGITSCGLYLALSFLLERIAVEGECDVISAVRGIRRSRTEFVQTLDQFECLYDAAVNYVKSFEIYANFS